MCESIGIGGHVVIVCYEIEIERERERERERESEREIGENVCVKLKCVSLIVILISFNWERE